MDNKNFTKLKAAFFPNLLFSFLGLYAHYIILFENYQAYELKLDFLAQLCYNIVKFLIRRINN